MTRKTIDLPPIRLLCKILDVKGKIFLFLWERRDKHDRVEMTWKELSEYYNKNKFKTALRYLGDADLIFWWVYEDRFAVEFINLDEVE
jgi:hypothetical protein